MFFSYVRHELRRRMRQAIVISLGLALGIGLVITVTAASSGVKSAEGKVLQSLYGVGTDVTVTKSPKAGSGGPQGFRIRGSGATKVDKDSLVAAGLGTLSTATLTQISHLKHVSAATGGLSLTDTRFSGTLRSSSSSAARRGTGSGGGASSFNVKSFTVDGVSVSAHRVGVLSSATFTSGRTFHASDSHSDVALVSSNYANQHGLKTGSSITVAGTKFTVIGIVSSTSSTDVVHPAGAGAGAGQHDRRGKHHLRVRGQRREHLHRIQRDLISAAEGHRDHLQ